MNTLFKLSVLPMLWLPYLTLLPLVLLFGTTYNSKHRLRIFLILIVFGTTLHFFGTENVEQKLFSTVVAIVVLFFGKSISAYFIGLKK